VKLLVLCPHFEPDLHAATGEVMTQLVLALSRRGHRIDVVTSLPWYRAHRVEPAWRGRPWRVERTAWGTVVRVHPFPTDKTNIAARAAGFAGFTGLATAAALALRGHEVVMGMSPPILLGQAALAVGRARRAPVVFNVQDIFPDVAVALGALTDRRVIAAASALERRLYRRADAVTVLSRDQAANVGSKLPAGQQAKVRVIPNFFDPGRVRPVDPDTPYRRQHGLAGKTVVMYSGNVGLSQSFDLVRQAALRFADRPSVQFVINGEGAARPEVDRWARHLPNVTVVDFAPRDRVSEVLGSADLHLILLKRGLARASTPSKLYSILGAARPVLASIDPGSEVAATIDEAGAGASVPPEDPDAFVAALERLLGDPAGLVAAGERGRAWALRWLTPDAQAGRYEALFAELVRHRASARGPAGHR
jgi:colanic acid biosynthesis glycosyl transferase WcaI